MCHKATTAMRGIHHCSMHGPSRYQVPQYALKLHSLEREHNYLIIQWWTALKSSSDCITEHIDHLKSKHNSALPEDPDRPVLPITCRYRCSAGDQDTPVSLRRCLSTVNLMSLISLESHSQKRLIFFQLTLTLAINEIMTGFTQTDNL